jgi:uncharacterized protein (DUF1684 family)
MKIALQFIFINLILAFHANAQDFAKQTENFREGYKAEFLKSPNSPLKKKDLAFLRFYEPDSSFRVKAVFTKTEKSEPFDMPTYSGINKSYVQYGTLTFELLGEKQILSVYRSLGLQALPQYRDYLFLPFKDKTNGKESYGGGRYIDLTTKDLETGKFLLDFNKCYNPYCAYSNGYNCPVPPKVNHLSVAIAAGEKNYGKEH